MKLILCCDYGLDDAAATVDALAHAEEDGYSEVVLVAVGGNVPAEVSLRNAKKLLAALPFSYPSATVVDTTAEAQPSDYLNLIHGEDGMGDLFAEAPASAVSAVAFDQWLNTFSGEYTLLSLGPMTLVPRILACGDYKKFVFMGGNIAQEPNFKGYEFNHALDRRAFAETVNKYPHVAVTMDTCRNKLFNVQKRGVKDGGLIRTIVNRSRELTFRSGEKGCYIWDDIAVKALRHPDWFKMQTAKDRDGNLLTVAHYTHNLPYDEIVES